VKNGKSSSIRRYNATPSCRSRLRLVQAIVSATALGATAAVCFPSGCDIDAAVSDACAAYGILIFTEHSLVAYATGK